jgi:hypothetical protein
MNSYGRLHETRLLVYYLLKTDPFKLFSFMPLGFRMLKRKRISYMPKKIKDLKNFQKIIKKAEQFDMSVSVEEVQYLKHAVGYSAVDKKTELEFKK